MNVSGQIVGTVAVEANSAGVCPRQCTGVISGVCTAPTALSWTPAGNEDYYQSEFLPNAVGRGSCTNANPNCDPVLWPEIVSEGCDTTSSAPATACNAASPGTRYARELNVLNPTAPLPMLEAVNQVTINSEIPNLIAANALGTLFANLNNSAAGALTSVLCNLLGGLTKTACNLIVSLYSTVAYGQDTTNNYAYAGLAALDGNIQAGVDIFTPDTTVGLNSSSSSLQSSLTSLLGNVFSLQSPLSPSGSLAATWTFGINGWVCDWNQQSTTNGWGSNCTQTPAANPPVHATGINYVRATSGTCSAATPVSQRSTCLVQPAAFTVTSPLFAGTTCGSGVTTNCVTYSGGASTSAYSSTSGDMILTAGSVQFAPGTYVLCGLYGTGTATVAGPSTGSVQIYVRAPSQCTANASIPSGLAQGDFIAVNGVDNLLTGTVNGSTSPTSLLDPSGFQIYLAGDAAENMQPFGSSSGTVPVNISASYDGAYPTLCHTNYGINTTQVSPTGSNACSDDPDTGVYIGDPAPTLSGLLASGVSPDEALVVYAPQSEVTVNTSLAFEGSLTGFNTDVTALAVLQDLNLGNYPLSAVTSNLQVAQTLQCSPGSGALTGTVSDTYGCG